MVRIEGPIAVLGAGNMGSGIAQACSQAGYVVRVRDVSLDILDRGRHRVGEMLDGAIERKKATPGSKEAVLDRISWTTELGPAVLGADLVVEAVFEEEAVKRDLFHQLAGLVSPSTIVVTNTSSLSVARLGEGFPGTDRFAGLHFFYPAAVNKLVEIIAGPGTSPSTQAALESLGYRLKKIPIRVQDSPGFCVNRFFVPFLNESVRIADDGLASPHTIEEVGRDLFGAALGPFELMNVTGIPIAYHSMSSLERGFGKAYAPAAGLRSHFESGATWDWKSSEVDPQRKESVANRLKGLVFGIATRLVEEGVAPAESVDRGASVGLRWKQGPFRLMSAEGLGNALRQIHAYAERWGPSFPVSRELQGRVDRGEKTWPLRSVRLEREGPIAWVLLDRPELLNSLNSELLAQLDQTFTELDRDKDVRAVVLAGSSPVFAAGADIAEMAAKDVDAGRRFGFSGQDVCRRIERFRTPVVALVEGYALGGGLELALAADFIVASEDAQLGLPEVTVGIHPGFGGATRLARLIGRAATKLLVFTGEPVSAAEAARLGFVSKVLPSASARDDARRLAYRIAEQAPLAVSWAKGVINSGMDESLDRALRLEGESAGNTFGTSDRTEGMRAFLERRKPNFTGK